jgi:hypothetical protein
MRLAVIAGRHPLLKKPDRETCLAFFVTKAQLLKVCGKTKSRSGETRNAVGAKFLTADGRPPR